MQWACVWNPLHNLKIVHQSPIDKCWHLIVLTLLGAFSLTYIYMEIWLEN